jgi:hypothetical protein
VDWRRGQATWRRGSSARLLLLAGLSLLGLEEEDGEEENRWFFSFLDFDGKYIFLVDDKV